MDKNKHNTLTNIHLDAQEINDLNLRKNGKKSTFVA